MRFSDDRSDDRTGMEPTTLYTFVGLATLRAHRDLPDFLVETSTEQHNDGTTRICVALVEGDALVWGEHHGKQIWYRENDSVARSAVEEWLANPDLAKARDHNCK